MLTADIHGDQGERLKPGDVGAVVHVHPGAEAYVVEFMALDNHTVDKVTARDGSGLRRKNSDLIHVRDVEFAV